jgi:hypothetical protein
MHPWERAIKVNKLDCETLIAPVAKAIFRYRAATWRAHTEFCKNISNYAVRHVELILYTLNAFWHSP